MKKIILILFILLGFSANCEDKKVINLNTIEVPPFSNPSTTGFDDMVVKEAFKRIGYTVNIIRVAAPERALENANSAIDDGTYSRTKVIEPLYKNLICVNETTTTWEAVIFSKRVKFHVSGWDSVKGYDVGYIKGWKILELNIRNAKSVITANDEENLFDLLINNRLDVVIYEKYQGLEILKNKNIKGVYVLDDPIVTASMFMYLNKKHTSLVPMLENALKEMKKDGTYDKIKKEYLYDLYK